MSKETSKNENINEKLFGVISSLKEDDIINEFIKNDGFDINCYDKYGRQYIHYAAEYNLTELAALLIEKGADVNAKAIETDITFTHLYKGYTPLHFLAKYEHCKNDKTAKLLIEKGADVNSLDANGRPPLLVLETNPAHKKLALLFIKNGADINAVDTRGENILSNQIHNASLDFVKELINKRINLSGNAGVMALCRAIQHRNIDYVHLLLEHGVSISPINISPMENFCPLAMAARKGDLALFNLLMEHGADPEKNVREILLGLFYGETDDIELLQNILKICTKNGINFNEENAKLINDAASTNAWWAIKPLVDLGADINNLDSDGRRPILYAALHDYTEAIEELIKAGVDLSGDVGIKALSCSKKPANVQLLINGGANVNGLNLEPTPLQFAVSQLQYKKIKVLLENGANPNLVGDQLESPLKIAVQKGRTDIIQLLLLHGADKNAQVNSNTTIADLAAKSKKADVASLFTMTEEQLKAYKPQGPHLRFTNRRLLFSEGVEKWTNEIKEQVKKAFGNTPLEEIQEEYGDIEYFDVVNEKGKGIYQLMLINYGDGALFAYCKKAIVGEIAQHGFNLQKEMSEEDESNLRDMLSQAYEEYQGEITQDVDFKN